MARRVSQRLLSDYLGRELSLHEVEAILLTYRSWGKVPGDLIETGAQLCREYLRQTARKEGRITVCEFKRDLGDAFIRQSTYQIGDSRALSLRLLLSALAFCPARVLSNSFGRQLLRLMLPPGIREAVRKLRVS